MIKGSKKIIEQGTSSTPEAQPVAFKATEENKEESTPSRLPIDASKLDNEEMALIIKSFRQILKQRRGKHYKPRSKKVCYKCGKPDHFIAKCPISSDSDRGDDKKGRRKVSAFRPRGVPGPTSKSWLHALAQMGRRETGHKGGRTARGNRGLRVVLRPGRLDALAVGGYKRSRGSE
jgi:hypothetical protein